MRYLLFIIVLILLDFVCVKDTRATVVMDWAPIGYAGNAGDPVDPSLGPVNPPVTFGAVNYNYQISKYDVTNNQYVEFLNDKDPTGANALGLYSAASVQNHGGITFDSTAASGSKYSAFDGRGTMPVNYVSRFSAMRFSNWLNNGQGNADTEAGAYTLLGGTPTPGNAFAIARSSDAQIVLPTENEWYKAAYYNPATATYLAFPGSNSPPSAVSPTGAANAANWAGAVGDLTNVGAYSGTMSSFGTFDQFGDVLQWLDPANGGYVRGNPFTDGAFNEPPALDADFPQGSLWNALGINQGPSFVFGFRVAMVPEPSGVVLAAFGLAGLAAWGWRRRRD